MPSTKKGLIEAISWKAIVSAIVAVLALYFGIPDYVYNIRPALVTSIGSGLVWFIEGAITGTSTFVAVLKLYSQFASKTILAEKRKQTPNLRQLKKRIRGELQILRGQISLDLQTQNFQSRTYKMDAFQNLRHDLVLGLDNRVFREIDGTYDQINGLQYSSNLGEISVRRYQEAIRSIDRSIDLLR